jgi:hypothetical protein
MFGGNTQSGLSPEQTTPPGAKRHATRCGHGVFHPAVAFPAGGQDRCGYWPPARALRAGQNPPCHGPVGFRIGSKPCRGSIPISFKEFTGAAARDCRPPSAIVIANEMEGGGLRRRGPGSDALLFNARSAPAQPAAIPLGARRGALAASAHQAGESEGRTPGLGRPANPGRW